MRRIRSSERWLHGPCATRLPYKRSRRVVPVRVQGRALYRAGHLRGSDREQQEEGDEDQDGGADERCPVTREVADQDPRRSEEHTSELQSPYDLVCRLLLEKKKKSRLEEI